MPKVSNERATKIEDHGLSVDICAPLDDYTVDFVTIQQEHRTL